MAPEQAAGDNREVGPPADVYALGAILYEMLTGRPPFRGATTLETLEQVRSQEVVPTRQLQARMPLDLDTICLKCLSKEPHRRYGTAGELADDLRRFLDGKPIVARPVGLLGRLGRWSRRKPALAAMLFTVTALLLVIFVGDSIGMVRLNTALERSRQADRATQEQLFDALLAQAHGNCLIRRPGQRFRSLEIVAEAARLARRLELPPEKWLALRNTAILALSLPDLYLKPIANGIPASHGNVDLDEHFAIYAWVDPWGNSEIRRTADDHLLHRLPFPSARETKASARGKPPQDLPLGVGLNLSQDGRFFLARRSGARSFASHAHLWRLSDDNPPQWLFEEQNVVAVHFDRDGRRLALGYIDGAVKVYELDVQQPARLLRRFDPAPFHRAVWVALHPTRPWLAVASYDGPNVVQVRDYRSGAVLASLPTRLNVGSVAWRPDGRVLAVSAGDGTDVWLYELTAFTDLWLFRSADFKHIRTLSAEGPGTRLLFNPAGDRLAAVDWNSRVQLFDPDQGKLLIQTPPARFKAFRFSHDGGRLAGGYDGDRFSILEVGDAREYRTLLHAKDTARRSGEEGYSPTGRVFAYGPPSVWTDNRLLAVNFDRVSFWDLATGQEVGSLPLHSWAHLLPPRPEALAPSWSRRSRDCSAGPSWQGESLGSSGSARPSNCPRFSPIAPTTAATVACWSVIRETSLTIRSTPATGSSGRIGLPLRCSIWSRERIAVIRQSAQRET